MTLPQEIPDGPGVSAGLPGGHGEGKMVPEGGEAIQERSPTAGPCAQS